MLQHPKPCVAEFKRRASKLRCMREELYPALARDVVGLLRIRGQILESSNGDFCGLDETMEMLSRQDPESVIHAALFEDIDDVFAVYVTGDAEIELQCIRMHRQTTTHQEMRALIGQRMTAANHQGRTTVLHIGQRELRIETSDLQVSNPGVQLSKLVDHIITNVRVYPFGVSLSFDLDLTLCFEEGDLHCGDRVWRVPDAATYGERMEGF